MPLILAIEPDKRQAAQLKVLVRTRLRADLILADTTELALEAIGDRIPDLVLVPALLSPQEDGALAAALRVIAAAAHVQTLTIPAFATSHAKKAPVKTGGLLAKLLAGKTEGAPEGCDPAVFGDQIAAYLAEAAASRDARDYDDDEFGDERPAPSAESFKRVETFATADSFQAAVEDFQSADVFATDERAADQQADPRQRETPPSAIVREPEQPAPAQTAAPSIFRNVDEPAVPPAEQRPSVFDSLFKRRDRQPAVVEPVEPAWPVYEPAPAVEDEAAKPAASDANNDWAPPADQSIALDLPNPTDESVTFAAADLTVIETADPVEEAVWAEHEADAEALRPQAPPAKWAPRSIPKPQAPPADVVAEFTAGLAAAPPLQPKPAAAAPAPRPTPPPKPQPVARPAPPQVPPTKPQPIAAQPLPPAPPPPKPQVAKPPTHAPAAQAALKPKTERPEWTALIDSLRQDMERMRHDRGRSKSGTPAAPPPHAVIEPTRDEAPVAAEAPILAASSNAAAQDLAAKRKKRPQKPTPVQDEWGFFDPQQCGFAALLAKLDEITENEESGKQPA